MKKKIILSIFCGFSLFLLLFTKFNFSLEQSQRDLNEPTQEETRKNYIENEWLLKVDSEAEAMNIALNHGLILKNVSSHGIALFYGYQSPFNVLTYNETSYKFQPNYLYYTQEVVINDPGAPQQFALDHLDAYNAWQYSLGAGVLVAIIDTGIEYNHDEFATNISPLSYNSAHEVVGYEAVNDDVGHGTAVAGVIAAAQNNAIGISGIAPAAELLVIKANVDNEGYFSSTAIVEGIYYAVANGADIINMSLGGAYPDPITEAACDYALSQGVIVVAAAGNDGLPILSYPASHASVISVGATTSSKERAEFSNFNREVDISAPGQDVYTTVMGNSYSSVSGTSFSSPYVAGVIALLVSYYDTEPLDMVLNYLYASAEDLGTFGKDSFYGFGMANAHDGLTITLRQVSFETFLGSPLDPVYVAEGRPFYITQRPTLEGHYFTGWYKDIDLIDRFDFEIETINTDITLYAKYEVGETNYPDDYDILINMDDTVTVLAYYGAGGEVIIPDSFYGFPVVEIGTGAFIFNQTISSITIPNTVTKIGTFAFAYMEMINSITIGTGLEELGVAAFVGNETLTSVEIQSNNLTQINEHAFASCTNLATVILPNSITYIQRYAFENTFNLHNFTFPSSLEIIGESAFSNSGLTILNLPDGLKHIGNAAFKSAAYITEVHFGSMLESIGQGVFTGCPFVEIVTLDIGNTNFVINGDILLTADQKGLIWYFPYNLNPSYIMPPNIEYLHEGAFSNAKFTSFVFNETLTHIPEQAFYQATELTEIVIPDNIKTMGIYVFHQAYGLVSVVLPKDMEKIPNGTFDRNIALKNVTFPENLITVGGAAFVSSGLEKVILPETVEVIEGWAFTSCYLLKEMYVPDGVRVLGNYSIPSIILDEMLPNLEFVGDSAINHIMMEEVIYPASVTEVQSFIMSGYYDKTRRVDFGSAREILLIASWGSRLQEIIINAPTEKARIEGESLFTTHIYVYGMDTELEVLFSDDYVIHAYQGSVAEQYALTRGLTFIDLDRPVVNHNVLINVDGPGTVYYPALVQDQELLHFELNIIEKHMVYEIKVNGQYIVNTGRSYFIRVTEDIVVDIKVRPIDYVIDYANLSIVDQVIVGTMTNSEYLNYPDVDEFANPILGFSNTDEFLTIIADNMYDTKAYRTYYHSNDIQQISFPASVTHIPLLNNMFRYLKSVDIPEGVLTMDGFEELQDIEYIILPSTLTEFPHFIDINDYIRGAFSYCTNLKSVVFKSELITEIPDYAFYFTPRLESIYIPTDLVRIGEYSFHNAISFKELILNNPLVEIASTAFIFKDYGYYYMGFSPQGEDFLKLPNFKLSSTEAAVLNYATYYNISYENADKHYLAYANQEILEIFIETVINTEDGIFTGTFSKSPFLMSMHVFIGWDNPRTNITSNTITYPIFTETTRAYLVEFVDPYTKEVISSEWVPFGGAATAPTNTERISNPKYSYIFLFWDQSFDNVQSDLVVEPVYTRILRDYTVRFYDWDDNEISFDIVYYGESATEPYLPPKDFYVFDSWSEDFTFVTKDLNVYPVRSNIQYAVTFYDFYGNWVETQYVTAGAGAIAPVLPDISGYIFIGWTEDITEIYDHLDVYPIYVQTESILTLIYNDIENVNILDIAGGQYSALILDDQNRLYGMGINNYGMLGSNQFSNINYPFDVTSAYNLNPGELITKIYLGNTNSIILTSEGRVIAAGNNDEGQLGIGSVSFGSNWPTDITANFNFNPDEILIDVTVGETHMLALSNQGRLFAWGQNSYGQLGTGDTNSRYLPTDVTASFTLAVGETIEHIKAGPLYSGVFTSLGKLYLWGFNQGQLADNTFDHHYSPNDITANFPLNPGEVLMTVKLHDGYGFALTSEQRVLAWGGGNNGTLTTGGQSFFPLPTDVTANLNLQPGEYVEELNLGFIHGYALTSNNRLLGWGIGTYGTLANGVRKEYNPVLDLTGYFNLGEDTITMVKTANYNGFVQTSSGKLYGFGMNNYGQVGVYSNRDILNPTLITFNNFDVGQYLYSYGDEIILPTLSQDTHNFLGWFYDYDLTQPVEIDFELTQDTILYPGWEIKTFVVRFFNYDGTLLKEEIVEFDGDATPPENPTREATPQFTYDFIGWSESFNYVRNDIDIYANYYEELRYYYVNFYNYDGAHIKTEHLPYGASATPPDEPSRVPTVQYSYLFSHWSEDFIFIASNLEINAVFIEVVNEYLVTFLNYDSSFIKEEWVPYGSAATPPDDPVRIGNQQYSYIFTGWETDYSFVTGTMFIHATFEEVINEYKVTFLDADENILKEEMVPYGGSATPPVDPVKPDTPFYTYTFLGWTGGGYTNVTEERVLTPAYQAIEIIYIYELEPGVDTVYQDSIWLDTGINYNQPTVTYRTEGLVDIDAVGNYHITYILEVDDIEVGRITRIVRVVAKPEEAVIITLNPGVSTLFVGDTYNEAGATSNVGTVTISGNVDTSKVGVYIIEYEVSTDYNTYVKYRYVFVYDAGLDLNNINAIIPQAYREEDEE